MPEAPTTSITICMGSSCFSRGNGRNIEVIQNFLKTQSLPPSVELVGHLCEGQCKSGPNVTINKINGRELGLQRGANVFMPNLTPLKYRKLYEIYPDKACMSETGDACNGCLNARMRTIGRHAGHGTGGRRERQINPALLARKELCHA